MIPHRRRTFLSRAVIGTAALVLMGSFATGVRAAEAKGGVQKLQTPSGVPFGLLGQKGAAPAPTLFVFAGDIQTSLTSKDYNRIGSLLAKHGFLSVALDIPCHGANVRPGESAGTISGWRMRLEKGEDPIAPFTRRVTEVLDYLVKEGYTDPNRVAAAGTSRGGFIALHVAAAEPRIRTVVAFAPVTDLLAVREFQGMEKHAGTNALHVGHLADKLAGRSVWLCIGNNDERVDTDQAIAFTRKLVKTAAAKKLSLDVELVVAPSPGHSIHKTAHDEAAVWLLDRVKGDKP
jgi:dienelactone hydrolase